MLTKLGWVFVVSTDLVSHLCVNREKQTRREIHAFSKPEKALDFWLVLVRVLNNMSNLTSHAT